MDSHLQASDIVNFYRLALGRDPESEAVVEEKRRQPLPALVKDFFSSGEFKENVHGRVVGGAALASTVHQSPPDEALKAWAGGLAPVSPATRQALAEAVGWYEIYHALFADEAFGEATLDEDTRARNPAFLAALLNQRDLERLRSVECAVEAATASEVRGWAVDTRQPSRRIALELHGPEGFLAGSATGRPRADIQLRHGGDGAAGFSIPRPVSPPALDPLRVELREAGSEVVLQAFELPPQRPAPIDAVSALRREVAGLQEQLGQLQARLPELEEAFSFALEDYSDYYDALYPQAPRPTSGATASADLLLVLDATEGDAFALDRVLASVAAQTRQPAGVAVLYPAGDWRLDFEAVLERRRGESPKILGVPVEDGGWTRAVEDLATSEAAARFLFVSPRTLLAPHAVETVADSGGAAPLLFADSDILSERHVEPALRTRFDRDLFLQDGDIGPLLGVTRAVIAGFGLQAAYGREALHDLVLRVVEAQGTATVRHLPRILAHILAPAPLAAGEGWKAAVQAHLSRTEPLAIRSEVEGPQGVSGRGLLRVRRPPPPGLRAAIIIPTRDRLDLLEPCLRSVEATLGAGQVAAEILVVDNRSQEAATSRFLQEITTHAPVRVIQHDAGFNWALINNRAAQETDADVLVFLNNDTLALSPDWCDELCAQAMRPEVGAVGARLLYGDGSIQHAGMVVGGRHGFAVHEGMGQPGGEPGYRGRHARVREVSCVTGACMATRAEVFHQLGGFDAATFPVESNDADYCLRVRAAGLAVIYDPYATLYHFESKSRGQNPDAASREAAEEAGRRLRARWERAYAQDPFYNPHFDPWHAPARRLRPPPPLASS